VYQREERTPVSVRALQPVPSVCVAGGAALAHQQGEAELKLLKENTWKRNINSGKAAPQSSARHLQFQLLTAVLGNRDGKLDNHPGNIFAITTATNVQVALHFFFLVGEKLAGLSPERKSICILVISKRY